MRGNLVDDKHFFWKTKARTGVKRILVIQQMHLG